MPAPASARGRARSSRIWTVLLLLSLLLLLALLPPLVNLGRYQRRIATSISLSLGRPVHLDHVSLNLLPLPSLTLQNLVVDEDPAFGEEPIIRANIVEAKLRVSSLWRRRMEFSRISFTDQTSVNLVLRPDGRWNLEDVLLQAAHIDAAPTAQQRASGTPRFPYIEATGARLNLKLGREKTPFSLTEADFALWLPQPQQWRMRLKARPMRTDTSATDTGSLQVEATLDRAASLAKVPLLVEVSWRNAPIGEAGRVLFGRDLGLRGSAELRATAHGTLAESALEGHLALSGVHRSDFVPEKKLQFEVDCNANAQHVFHAFAAVRCSWPVPDSDGAVLALTGSVPDVLHPRGAEFQVGTGRLPARVLLDWLRIASARIPADATLQGNVSGSLSHDGLVSPRAGSDPAWSGRLVATDVVLASRQLGDHPLVWNSMTLSTSPADVAGADPSLASPQRSSPASPRAVLEPLLLPLGGRDPAVLEGSLTSAGYTLHLSGSVIYGRLFELAETVPQLGDGLADILPRTRAALPVHLDLIAVRNWGATQVWTEVAAHPRPPAARTRQHRR